MTSRRQLLKNCYSEFLGAIEPFVHDIEKVKSAGINTDWPTTLMWLSQVTEQNAELIIRMYALQDEVKEGHYESALEVVKNFIQKLKSL